MTDDSGIHPLVIISFRKEIMFWVCYLPTLRHNVIKYPVFFWQASLMHFTQTFVCCSIQLFSKKRFCSVETGVNWWKYLFQILLKVKMCSEKINLAPSVLMSFLFNILGNIILSVDSVHWASLVVENYSVQTWLLNNYQSQLWTNILSEIAF